MYRCCPLFCSFVCPLRVSSCPLFVPFSCLLVLIVPFCSLVRPFLVSSCPFCKFLSPFRPCFVSCSCLLVLVVPSWCCARRFLLVYFYIGVLVCVSFLSSLSVQALFVQCPSCPRCSRCRFDPMSHVSLSSRAVVPLSPFPPDRRQESEETGDRRQETGDRR